MATKKKAATKPAKAKPAKKPAEKKAEKKPPIKKTEQKEEKKPKIAKVVTKANTITHVKLTSKNSLEITSVKLEGDSSSTEVTEVHKDRTVHPDLKQSMEALRVHFALLNENISTQQIKKITDYNEDLVERFVVTSVSIKTKKDNEGYVLSGYKKLSDGSTTPGFSTRFARVEQEESTRYRYMDDLIEKVNELLGEVKMYQTGEKVGEAQQPELGFPEDEDGENDPFNEEAEDIANINDTFGVPSQNGELAAVGDEKE